MKINKSFLIEPVEDNVLIAEAFWIEKEYKNEILNIELPNKLPLITYITGESGCWKTTLLKELNKKESKVKIQKNIVLCKWGEKYGLKEEQTLQYLSIVWLSDAILFLSKFDNLSDSQKYRARIAELFMRGDDEIILDEFLSTLDRKTAKSVSFCIQKACRKLNKKLICVTAHSDLKEYLLPDLIIEGKAFPSKWSVKKNKNIILANPYLNKITIKKVDKYYYKDCELANLHYKWKYTGGVKEIYSMELENETIWILLTIFEKVNKKEWRKISRVVIHPSYRWIWLGQELVKYCLQYSKENNMDVTAISSMSKFNPFFEKAGMKRLQDANYKPKNSFIKELELLNFNFSIWYKRSYCEKCCEMISFRNLLAKYSKDFNKHVNVWGVHISDEEVKEKLINFPKTAWRILWFLRPRTYAKYKFETKIKEI